jgi:preprotein translocase subunit SecA
MQTLATITFQNYFRLYGRLAGMTGTAITEAEEFHKIYNLEVVVIPTHKPMIRDDSPDSIYKTEEAKFNAAIEEILEMHAQARPVLVGTVSIEKSERLSRALQKRGIEHEVLNAKYHEREAAIIAQAGQPGAVTIATNMAGRGTDIVLGAGVAQAGGLHIIGTERHESRRIDNQLRGRSGRQGDPGSSRFFIALDDDLMRVFGSDRIRGVMNFLGLGDDEKIEHTRINRALEGAQSKVEGHNFDARRHIVEYDDVMNTQRAIIYGERRKILEGDNMRATIEEWIGKVIEGAVPVYTEARHPDDWQLSELVEHLQTMIPVVPPANGEVKALGTTREQVTEALTEQALAAYDAREAEFGEEIIRKVEQIVMLRTIDSKWVNYLTTMEQLKEGIGMRAFGQKDPLIEYKNEAYQMFQELTESIQVDTVTNLFRVQIEKGPPPPPTRQVVTNRPPEGGTPAGGRAAAAPPGAVGLLGGKKVGRNDPCPCGSGAKYKKCHGR